MKIDTYRSVWDAISDSSEEAANLKLRSQLMDILAAYIRNEGITQKEAALRFGISRSRVSELVNDRISKFTIDKLVNMAARVGMSPLKVDADALTGSVPKTWYRHNEVFVSEPNPPIGYQSPHKRGAEKE